MKSKLSIISITILIILFASVVVSFAADSVTLTLTTGPVGGGWYIMGAGVSEFIKEKLPEINLKVLPGGGSLNAPRVNSGEVDLGWGINTIDLLAYKGEEMYDEPCLNLRSIGGSFMDGWTVPIVYKDFKAETFEEVIKNKMKINFMTTPKGGSSYFTNSKILEYYGYDFNDIKSWGGKLFYGNSNESANMFKDKHVDMVQFDMGHPCAMYQEMGLGRDVKLLPHSQGLIDYLEKEYGYSGGSKAVMPKGTYSFQDKDISAPAWSCQLLVNKDIPEEIVYKITKLFCENAEELRSIHNSLKVWDPKEGWKWISVPLHPGAERYYKEVGYLK